jgi:dTDP-4-amino-4,6-dideoxygalactose transaminase
VQLGKLDAIVRTRRARGARYGELLGGVDGLAVVTDPPWGTINFQSCWALLPPDFPCSRDALLQHLLDRGISARRGIMASHLEPACADIPHGPLPATERIANDSLILPLFHEMTDAEQDRVVEAMLEAAGPAR